MAETLADSEKQCESTCYEQNWFTTLVTEMGEEIRREGK